MNRKTRRTQASLTRRAGEKLVLLVDPSVPEEEFLAVKAHMAKQGMEVARNPQDADPQEVVTRPVLNNDAETPKEV